MAASNIESNTGLGVKTVYGVRSTQEGVLGGGAYPSVGAEIDYVIYIRGDDFTSGAFDTKVTVPAGSKFLSAQVEITEAFALGGTTPTMNIGTSSSAGTNYGLELSEAQAEATNPIYNATGAGTWANPLAADTVVAVELDGTSPTVTSAGKAKVVLRFLKI